MKDEVEEAELIEPSGLKGLSSESRFLPFEEYIPFDATRLRLVLAAGVVVDFNAAFFPFVPFARREKT